MIGSCWNDKERNDVQGCKHLRYLQHEANYYVLDTGSKLNYMFDRNSEQDVMQVKKLIRDFGPIAYVEAWASGQINALSGLGRRSSADAKKLLAINNTRLKRFVECGLKRYDSRGKVAEEHQKGATDFFMEEDLRSIWYSLHS